MGNLISSYMLQSVSHNKDSSLYLPPSLWLFPAWRAAAKSLWQPPRLAFVLITPWYLCGRRAKTLSPSKNNVTSDFSYSNHIQTTEGASLFRYELLVLSWLIGVLVFRMALLVVTFTLSLCLLVCLCKFLACTLLPRCGMWFLTQWLRQYDLIDIINPQIIM